MDETGQFAIQHDRIQVTDNESVHLASMFAAGDNKSPAIISVHGTGGPGYGARRWRLRFGQQAVDEGFHHFVFDSRGTGYSDGNFEDWSVSKFIEDTVSVLEWVREQPHVDDNRIGLFGFSLGSAVSVLVAAKRPELVKSLALYTIPRDMDRGFLWYFERFVPRSLDSLFGREGRVWLPPLEDYLNRSFLDDLENHDVIGTISGLDLPVLLIQPEEDDQVPAWVSNKAFNLIGTKKKRREIKGSHTMYSYKDGETSGWNFEQEQQTVQETLKWFQETLV